MDNATHTGSNTVKKAIVILVLVFTMLCVGDGARTTKRIRDYDLDDVTDCEGVSQ